MTMERKGWVNSKLGQVNENASPNDNATPKNEHADQKNELAVVQAKDLPLVGIRF